MNIDLYPRGTASAGRTRAARNRAAALLTAAAIALTACGGVGAASSSPTADDGTPRAWTGRLPDHLIERPGPDHLE